MAEQIPYGVAANLISKLVSLAFRELGQIYGVMDELDSLKATLESIQLVLSDAEQRQHGKEDAVVEHWIRRFKEVLHEADDLLDDLAIKDLRSKVNSHKKTASKVRDFFSSENPLVFRGILAHEIKNIRKKFNAVAEDMSKLKLNPSVVVHKQNESESAWRETSSFVLESTIVGREEDKNKVVDLLKETHANQNVSLIAIVGMGGLGKTALAQMVYNDVEVQQLFQKKMWVCISEDFEVKTVLKNMLKSLKNDEVGDLQLDIFQKKVREELNEQRYLLVLDDVWNENPLKWDALKTYLTCGRKGSKILVTTRSEMVVQTMGINNPYVLKGLTKEQSWALLKNLAFGEHPRRISPNLASIGEMIAEKCGGVPLAIKTMGGLLQSKNEESEWLNILEGDFWRLCKENDSIMPVLKLSYQSLPLGLRQCFAYCCLYPKDWEIEKDELIQLWMAQGYLESSMETQSTADVGNEYVKILLMRSFFQEASMSEYNDIISFKMHDLMHDLAKSVAGNDCYLACEGKGIVGRPMHVSFISSSVFSLDSLDGSKVRTVLLKKARVEFVLKPSIIKNLKFLRVLDLSLSCITKLPESIDKLKHLRYIDFTWCSQLTCLPKSIGNLVSLQTLKLFSCENLVFPIEIITKLINLRYLKIDHYEAFKERMPPGIGKLKSLEYLPIFVVGDDQKMKSGKLSELKDLNNIKDQLWIKNLDLVKDAVLESKEANLKAKKYITNLRLSWENGLQSESLQLLDNLCPHQNLRKLEVIGYPGVRFSSWLPSLANVVEIVLWNFSKCQHLPPMERLPFLESLWIRGMDELQYMDHEEICDVFFPSLKTLRLERCKNLKGWRSRNDNGNHVSLPPFPRLSSLWIAGCPNLTCMPTFPSSLRGRCCEVVKPIIENCLD